ncbi:hypothetical protein R0137_09330 [Congregibacter brevis]|uniref:Uncharacterized protein n=1 Tax=Congregibacter brevis TaxID=3081201 RepID=A0ABZ0I9K1_9GAMM|nr:hypothetical protein R0137_09330 [Congregibacter sp. IMCC45268]
MTEPEVIEMINSHASAAMNSFTIYLTLTFAFLTTIYVVGAKLSKTQAVVVTLLYQAWAISFGLVSITHLRAFDSIAREYPEFMRSQLFTLPWSYFSLAIIVFGLLVSLSYAISNRKESSLAAKVNIADG